MRIFKHKCLRCYNSFIIFLISFLGFASSCDILGGKAMYGTPSADFLIKGKIEDASANVPLKGIKVVMEMNFGSVSDPYIIKKDSTFSSAVDGSYQVIAKSESAGDQKINLRFTDIDGTNNGQYKSLDTTIVFQNLKFSNGSGSWDKGETVKEVNIKLQPK